MTPEEIARQYKKQQQQTRTTQPVKNVVHLQRLKQASELGENESSPCPAINADRELHRVTHSSQGWSIEYRMELERAQEAVKMDQMQCRLCNPQLTICQNPFCQIPSKALSQKKGYNR